jgi:PHD/YefM family antitoxin component YafN of YafNO toxin-antitoxin module
MVKYAQNELFSVTDFTKQLGSAVKSIKEHSIEKIGILKNNRLEAVVISTDEYERLKELEEIFELAEHTEIFNLVQERKKTPESEYISMQDLAKKLDVDLNKL